MKGFFRIESIPDVMFLFNHTTFEDCKLIKNDLTKKEYDEAISDYRKLHFKSEKKVISDKKLKTKIKDKSLTDKIDKEENRFEK